MLIINRPTFLLDTIGTPGTGGVSLRLLSKRMWGEPIFRQVRRSSDNAARAIYHDRDGNLDAADLLQWAGTASVYVVSATDPTGSGRDAVQTDPTKQPRIVNAGVLETVNGGPTLSFNNSVMSIPPSSYSAGFTVFAVAGVKTNFGSGNALVTKTYNNYANPWDFLSGNFFTGNGNSGGITLTSLTVPFTAPSGFRQWTYQSSSAGGANAFTNGVANGSTATGSYNDNGTFSVVLGSRYDGQTALTGWISEAILFNFAWAAPTRQSIERNQGQYFGIPIA